MLTILNLKPKQMRKLVMLMACLTLFISQILAQNSRTISGNDENGAAISNASIIVKGTTIGTTTANDGTLQQLKYLKMQNH